MVATYATVLSVKDAGESGSYVPIAKVRDVKGPGLKLDTEEVTTYDSNGWKEYEGTLIDGGEVSFELEYDPSLATHSGQTNNANGLAAMLIARAPRDFKVTFPDAAEVTFTALVTEFEPEAPVGGTRKASVKMQVTGAVVMP